VIRLFRTHIIGGCTGKRESAWFVFLLWTIWSIVLIWIEAIEGPSMEGARSMWNMVTPFVFTWLGAAHGFEWFSTQTPWGLSRNRQDRS